MQRTIDGKVEGRRIIWSLALLNNSSGGVWVSLNQPRGTHLKEEVGGRNREGVCEPLKSFSGCCR